MENYVKKGDSLDVTLAGTKLSGSALIVTDRAGIVTRDGVLGDVVPVLIEGIVTYPKAALAMTIGQKLYYDSGADKATTSNSGTKAFGWAASAQASGDANVQVKLGGF